MQIQKPQHRQERERKRRAIRKADAEFQDDMPDRPTCCTGHSVDKEQAAKHHAKHRRAWMEYRYDESNVTILCWQHHNEIHARGEAWFYATYWRSILRFDRNFFDYLNRKYGPSATARHEAESVN